MVVWCVLKQVYWPAHSEYCCHQIPPVLVSERGSSGKKAVNILVQFGFGNVIILIMRH